MKAESPTGSFYFHLPGDKRELALEVIDAFRKQTVAAYRALVEANQRNGGIHRPSSLL
jgi:hypothetical protein